MALITVAVIGPDDEATVDDVAVAYEVGRRVAEQGWVLATGGRDGVMRGASAGAAEAGGTVVGMLPGDDSDDANPFVSVALPLGVGEARNALLVNSASAVIGVGCSWGTLSEVAMSMRAGKPIVVIGGWSVVDRHGRPVAGPVQAATPREAIALVSTALGISG